MSKSTMYPALTCFLVVYSDGERRPTDMAAGITLAEARDYFVGKQFEITETTFHTAVEVLPLKLSVAELGKIMLEKAGEAACQKAYDTTDPELVGISALGFNDINRDGTLN